MPAAPRPLCDQTYALRLCGTGGTGGTGGAVGGLAGELEHVRSGDCLGFDSGAGLLAALMALQALQARRASVPVSPGRSPAAAG